MADEQKDTSSLLGRGSDFVGKLTFFGTVRIEGHIEGEILSDDTLVVAPGGEVRGTVNVGTLIVTGGLVEANITAKQAVEIHPDGRLIGEVTSPVFQIERGAIFQGNCSMPKNSEKIDDTEQ
ncbi:MAG: polymer-forming cytoskeletal protein [Proteobacteria bacterium]|nr:polymer-forming cytoskeletal protein [Pseudomonadota bacterium]